jgi:hypothetical protein
VVSDGDHGQHRLWLGASVSQQRNEGLIGEIVQLVRETALARPLLICVDGLRSYISAIQTIFRSSLPARTRGRRRLIAWPDIHIGRVIKLYQGKRVVEIIRRMAQGSEKAAQAADPKSRRNKSIPPTSNG